MPITNKLNLFRFFLPAVLIATPFFNGSKGPVAVFILETVILSAFCVFAASYDIKKTSIDKPVIFAVLCVLFSAAATLYLNASLNSSILLAAYILLFYTAVSMTDDSTRKLIHLALCAAAAAASLIVITQVLTEKLPAATFPNKNMAAGYIAYGASLVFAKLLLEKKPPLFKSALAFSFMLFVIAILLTRSRGGLLALACAVAFTVHQKYKKWGLLVFSILILSAFVVIPKNKIADMAKISGGDSYALGRLKIWKSAAGIIKEKPLTGTGPGNFGLLFPKQKFEGNTDIARFGKITRFAHNEFLNVASECGILCLAAFAWVWIAVFRKYKASLASSAVLVAVVSQSFFDFNLHLPAIAVMAVLLTADIVREKPPVARTLNFNRKYMIAAAAALAAFNILNYCFKPFDAEKYKIKADNYIAKDPSRALALYKKAVKLSPNNYEYRQAAGELYYITGDKKSAVENLERSAALNPKNPFVYKSLGQYYFNEGKYKIAEYYFLKAVDIEPNYLEAKYYLAKACEKLNMPFSASDQYAGIDEAKNRFKGVPLLSSYEKSLLDIDMPAVYNSAGLLDLSLNETEKALAVFNRALEIKPDSAETHSNIASVYYFAGDYAAALKHAELAVSYGAGNPQHIKNLILIHEKLGNKNETAKLQLELDSLKKQGTK